MNTEIQSTLEALQAIALIIGTLAVLGPIAIGAMLWRISKSFVSKDEFNGLGSRVTAYESFSIATRERADAAHEKIRENEAALAVRLDWIRRDLDLLLRHAEDVRDRHRDHPHSED